MDSTIRDRCWQWEIALGVSLSHRYHRVVLLDNETRIWCDRKLVITSPHAGRYIVDGTSGEASLGLSIVFMLMRLWVI